MAYVADREQNQIFVSSSKNGRSKTKIKWSFTTFDRPILYTSLCIGSISLFDAFYIILLRLTSSNNIVTFALIVVRLEHFTIFYMVL